jgi:hypothetical protein
MPTLIACLSTGKGTWAEVSKLIQAQPWQRIFLVTNQFGKEHFNPPENTKLIVIDDTQEMSELVRHIKASLHGKITDFEVGVNLTSGSGKEHMVILQAIMELGLNFRLVSIDRHGLLKVF